MKILVTGTGRSGTTAYCDTLVQTTVVKQNFNECFNIDDLLIPRDLETDKRLIEGSNTRVDHWWRGKLPIGSKEFLTALDNDNWDIAWRLRPLPNIGHSYYLDYDEDMQYYKKQGLPYDLEEFKEQQAIRWNRLKNIDSWCIKIFRHHGVNNKILEEIINTVDRVDILFRRDRVQQAISLLIADYTLDFHNVTYVNEDKDFFSYRKFEHCVQKIIREEQYFNRQNLYLFGDNIIYYEDLDLTSSTIKKNKYSIRYDLDRCKEIVKKYENT
jgi:hypothetical protein